jgi:large subunit ribosomal protein L5
MKVPELEKVVINMGLGEAVRNPGVIDTAMDELEAITGQQPVVTKARRSIAGFNLRKGAAIGAKVTLRERRMYEFLERLIYVALPRVRDFEGISRNAFDGHGNYTLGLEEQIIFPEIDYDSVDSVRGMSITMVTTAETDEEALSLLDKIGLPFEKTEQQQ